MKDSYFTTLSAPGVVCYQRCMEQKNERIKISESFTPGKPDYVFAAPTGDYYKYYQIYTVFKSASKKAEFEFPGIHSLRAIVATNIYQKTGSLEAVMHVLGHRCMDSSIRYLMRLQ